MDSHYGLAKSGPGEAYWALGRSREIVERSVANSNIVCGAYRPDGELVGFARMVTDLATFAYLCDVFVVNACRGDGLGKAIVDTIVHHPDARDLKRQLLATADAHDLYRRFDYEPLAEPERWMIRNRLGPAEGFVAEATPG